MTFSPFLPRQPIASVRLPLTLLTLDDWVLINVNGQDSEKYLQSQVTADVAQLTRHQHLLVAHCNPKGKMWSTLRLFRRGEGFSFSERRSVRDIQLTELKKYAVFSQVTFTYDEDIFLLGIAGFQARAAMESLFSELPNRQKPLVNDNDGVTSLLWFEHPAERFLLVTDETTAHRITKTLRGKAQFNNSQQWLALHIEAGIPVIDSPNSGKFIPQATNLQALDGINFKKGCYTGQEMVARAKFRGANKLALWYLAGTADRVPEVGEDLELQIGENWRRTGTILAAVQLDDGRLLLQAVMNKDMELNSVLRVLNDVNTLNIESLPYLLEE